MSSLGLLKFMFGGMKPDSIAIITLATEHKPDAGSEWPMFDFTEPISKGSVRPGQNTFSRAFTSSGSPTYTWFKLYSTYIIKYSVDIYLCPGSVCFNPS